MGAPVPESYPDGSAMLLCTCCETLVVAVVTVQDRRGGASLCVDCLAVAWEALEAHTGTEGDDGGDGTAGVTELF